jgi:hypothetical protein
MYKKTHNTPDHIDPSAPAVETPAASGDTPAPAASDTPSIAVVDTTIPIVPSLNADAGNEEVDPAAAGLVWDGAFHSTVNEHGVWMASVAAPIEDVIHSHSPSMFDDDFDDYHVRKAMEREATDEFSDSFEDIGDIKVLTKECWCGGIFDVSRDPNVVEIPHVLEPQEVGAMPSVDRVEAESCRCTSCGCIDLFHQLSPFACLYGSSDSIPASDEWLGIALESGP